MLAFNLSGGHCPYAENALNFIKNKTKKIQNPNQLKINWLINNGKESEIRENIQEFGIGQ